MDFSYRGRFIPWIFRTVRTTDYSYHSRTSRTIAYNSDVSMKLDDADDKPSIHRIYGLPKASYRQTYWVGLCSI